VAAAPLPAETSFAYTHSHPVKPLPDQVIAQLAPPAALSDGEPEAFAAQGEPALDVHPARPQTLSRASVCSAVASAARANDLPVPFFANLIWQESGFNARSVSPAGAQGIAQFMPTTAKEYGLSNPFDPIHALSAAGRFLNKLVAQFGNLGLAAAAYNAGPGRVNDFMTRRRKLPDETKNYVVRITGRPAEKWASRAFVHAPEARLMPAKAPCVEVAQEVAAEVQAVHAAKLAAAAAAAAVKRATAVASAAPRAVAHAAGVKKVRTALATVKAKVAAVAGKKLNGAPVKMADRVVAENAVAHAGPVQHGKAPANKAPAGKTVLAKTVVAKTAAKAMAKSGPGRSQARTRVASAR
jgi:hypothetical protein